MTRAVRTALFGKPGWTSVVWDRAVWSCTEEDCPSQGRAATFAVTADTAIFHADETGHHVRVKSAYYYDYQPDYQPKASS